jgi:protein gp37
MGTKTNISWTTHSYNPWWGCVKVHDGCKNCYAERESNRYGYDVWGPHSERRMFGDKHWNEPMKWNKVAEREGQRHRVFCASMADVFEDHPALPRPRGRLFDLICRTPYLDWQVLTKRPENALRMMVEAGLYACENPDLPCPQPNLWIGTSPCNQATLEREYPLLRKVPAALRFISYEPAIDEVDLTGCLDGIGWVIIGGESGPKAREFDVLWAEKTIGQCRAAGVPVFVKQLGENPMIGDSSEPHGWPQRRGVVDWETGKIRLRDRKGADPSEWPEHLRVQEFPVSPAASHPILARKLVKVPPTELVTWIGCPMCNPQGKSPHVYMGTPCPMCNDEGWIKPKRKKRK